MGAKLLLAVLMKGQNMELIIRSMIKQYYSKLQIKVVNIESVLALLFAMLSFTIFAFAIASSNNLKLLFILLACIFVVASQILSAISDNKYYKSKTSITNKKEKLIMLNELLQSNNLIDLSNKEKLKCFYKHVEKYYDENNEKITKAEALFNKSAAVIIIPVTFVYINQVFNHYTNFEDAFTYSIAIVAVLIAILFALFQTCNLHKAVYRLLNLKLKMFLDDLTILVEFELK